MSLKIIDKKIYLNDKVISKKAFKSKDIIEVVNLQKEYLNDFYKLKNCDIYNNIEIYCNEDGCSINLCKEEDETYITKVMGINNSNIKKSESLINDFSNKQDIEISIDQDSLTLNKSNLLFTLKLEKDQSVQEASVKIDTAYKEFEQKIS